VALPDDPVVFGRVGLRQERHLVVVHRDGAVGGDADFLAILHGVRKSRPSWSMVTILVSFQMSARMMPGADTVSMWSA
jgi:hypothetical protein